MLSATQLGGKSYTNVGMPSTARTNALSLCVKAMVHQMRLTI